MEIMSMSTKEISCLEVIQKVKDNRMCLDRLDNQAKKKRVGSCIWECVKSNAC